MNALETRYVLCRDQSSGMRTRVVWVTLVSLTAIRVRHQPLRTRPQATLAVVDGAWAPWARSGQPRMHAPEGPSAVGRRSRSGSLLFNRAAATRLATSYSRSSRPLPVDLATAVGVRLAYRGPVRLDARFDLPESVGQGVCLFRAGTEHLGAQRRSLRVVVPRCTRRARRPARRTRSRGQGRGASAAALSDGADDGG